jgi:DNA-binding MarR family transcriptional regulator
MMAAAIEHFIELLRELQKIDPEFPLQYAVCLAEISLNEGMSLTHLSERTGMPLSTISRIVGALSRHRQGGRPYGLVRAVISKTERRRKELYLTAQGRTVMSGIAKILDPAEPLRLRA